MKTGMKLSLLAVMWCRSPEFIAYLNRHIDGKDDEGIRYGIGHGYLDPASYIRERCGIQSRMQLDTDTQAANIFHRDIRHPFIQWQKEQRQCA